MKKAAFGVDIGGTSVKLGLVSADGKLLDKAEFPSDKSQSALFDEIAAQIRQMLERAGDVQCVGVGVGVPGPVLDKSLVQGCVNLGWGNVNVTAELSCRVPYPILAENDANLAALGEMWMGAGHGLRNLVMFTVGTGIGAGIIADGRIVSGAVGGAGEVGHIPMGVHLDRQCSCGKYGCLETIASATGIIRSAREFSPFREMETVTAKDVFDAARDGNEDALSVVNEAGRCLGTAAAIVGCVVNPEVFVIGGGVSAAGNLLLDPIKSAFQEWVFPPCRNTRFALATLGNNAGIFGAAGQFLCKG